MPLELRAPRKGKTPHWTVRGTYLGVHVERSTRTSSKRLAQQFLKKWEGEIERGEFATEGEPTFLAAAVGYMKAGGERKFVKPLLDHFGELPLRLINQATVDAAAVEIYPSQTSATRNRQVYTPVSAILKHAGIEFKLRRPKGSRGQVVTRWLWPEQAFRVFKAARTLNPEFAIFLELLCYTGPRLSEGLSILCEDVRLGENFAFIGHTKNGDPRPVFLPPHLVASLANHPRGLERPGERVFRFHKGGALSYLLEAACRIACGLAKPARVKQGPRAPRPPYELDWVNFHTFCHTWATWMRRYGGVDELGLVETGRWRDRQSAARYAHSVAGESARKAALLPTLGSLAEGPGENAGTAPFALRKLL
jgi:integrase